MTSFVSFLSHTIMLKQCKLCITLSLESACMCLVMQKMYTCFILNSNYGIKLESLFYTAFYIRNKQQY